MTNKESIQYLNRVLTKKQKMCAIGDKALELYEMAYAMAYTPREGQHEELRELALELAMCLLLVNIFPDYQAMHDSGKWVEWAELIGETHG